MSLRGKCFNDLVLSAIKSQFVPDMSLVEIGAEVFE